MYLIDKLTKYNYKVHYWPCKANILQIADRMSCISAKYSQHATKVDLEKIVLTVIFFQSQLLILFTQLSAITELSH